MDCDICCDSFNEREKEPKILVRCGHTICAVCIDAIRRTSGNDISCPHCRVATRFDEIRSNFAIRGLLDKSETIARNVSDRPFCVVHATNQVSVFCVPCGQFLCPECFDTVNALHSTHARVSFNDGLKKIREELDHFSESCNQTTERTSKDLQQLHMLHQELSRLNDTCVGHFNRVLESFKSQLVQVQVRLHESDLRLQAESAEAVNKLNTAKAIEQLVTRIKQSVPTHLDEYMKNRHAMNACIASINSDVRTLENDLNQVTINREKVSGVNHPEIPRIALSFPDSYQIFKFEEDGTNESRQHHERVQRRTLHRKTSNDELKD